MATISSHTLDGTDGTHASGIVVFCRRLDTGQILFKSEMDSGGRLSHVIESERLIEGCRCELVFDTGSYWGERSCTGDRVIDEIVLRFTIDDPDGSYHMPIILSPYSYSTWKSG